MIAILLAAYNGEEYIARQLDSLLEQSESGWKCYIHDDGSNDRTLDIIGSYIAEHPDRFCLLPGESTGGAKNNFLYMMRNVEEDYYMFCDQDDCWLPDKIKIMYRRIRAMRRRYGDIPLLAFSDMKVVDKDLNTINESYMKYADLDPRRSQFRYLISQNTVPGCVAIFNRELRDRSNVYRNIDDIRWHDWWISLIAAATGRISYVDQPLSLYRQHGDNNVGAVADRGPDKVKRILKAAGSFSQVRETKERIGHFVRQARELSCAKLPGTAGEIVAGFQNFDSMNKFQRQRFFIRYRIFRNKRNIWQLLCL